MMRKLRHILPTVHVGGWTALYDDAEFEGMTFEIRWLRWIVTVGSGRLRAGFRDA